MLQQFLILLTPAAAAATTTTMTTSRSSVVLLIETDTQLIVSLAAQFGLLRWSCCFGSELFQVGAQLFNAALAEGSASHTLHGGLLEIVTRSLLRRV